MDERTERLEELVGELERFSYTITHDMRAPLRAMRGFSEFMGLACEDCERKEPKEYLRRIAASAERMDCLITDALNYSRAVKQELPLEDVDCGEPVLAGVADGRGWDSGCGSPRAAERLRNFLTEFLPARLPVVIFSSSTKPEDRAKARELGATEFWEKPNSALKFASVVERVREEWLSSGDGAG